MDRLTVPQEKKMCRSWSSQAVPAAPVPVLRNARSWGDRPQQAALTSTPTMSPEQMETSTAEQLREFERVVAALEDADGGRTPTNADCVRLGVLSQAQRMLDVVVGPQPPPVSQVPTVTLAAVGAPCGQLSTTSVAESRCRRPDVPAAAAAARAGRRRRRRRRRWASWLCLVLTGRPITLPQWIVPSCWRGSAGTRYSPER